MRPAVVVLLAAIALAGLGHLINRPEHEPMAPRALAQSPPVVLGGALDKPTDGPAEEQDAGFTPHSSAGARRAAQRFLAAYLRWETGDESAETEHELRTSATPQLTQLLSSGRGQPDPNGRISRAKLASLIAGSVSPDRAATIAAQLTRDGQPSGLAMVLKRHQGRWRVTSIGR